MDRKYFSKPLNAILVKPAGPDCNMACTYCFYLKKSDLFPTTKTHRMSGGILEEMIRQVMSQAGQHLSFGWQGGEPTLMGIPFFQKAVDFQKRYGYRQTVGNGLQTNGLLIDKDWADFLQKYNFLVGLSLDGPQHVHDRYRLMVSGKGSWSRVVDSAKRMLDRGVAVNALSVVNDYSVQFPEEIYQFHKDTGLAYMQFIPCLEMDPDHRNQIAPFSVPAEAYGKFFCRLFDLWQADFKDGAPTTSIRFFESLFFSYVDLPPPECTLLPTCGVYVVVEHNGDVYSCDFFVEEEWKLGNICNEKLVDLLNSEKQHTFGQRKAELPQICLDCLWLKQCRGSCPRDRIDLNKPSYFCQSFKIFFEHADARLRQLASEWRQKQACATKQEAVLRAINLGKIHVGRNDPCPCGSGKKFKRCCGGGLG